MKIAIKKVLTTLFVLALLISLSGVVEAARNFQLPSARPTVQVLLSHSPVLEEDDLEVTIRAKDDKGVKAISVAPSFSQPIIVNCQINGRSLRTCEKGFVFRMPRGQQRFIITALDDENQQAIKTVRVNVLPVNEDIDVQVGAAQLTSQSLEELPLELELLVTIAGNAEGVLCYTGEYDFVGDNGEHVESLFDQTCEPVRSVNENGQAHYETIIRWELFDTIEEGQRGMYAVEFEAWLQDEDMGGFMREEIREENEENNRYESIVRVEESCEERINSTRREVGTARTAVSFAFNAESNAKADLYFAQQRNASAEEIEQLRQQIEEMQEETDDTLQEEMDARDELTDLQEECGLFENPDLVITNAHFIPNPTELGRQFLFEFEYENQGNASLYGSKIEAEFWFPERDELGNYLPGGFNFATDLEQDDGVLEPGEKETEVIEADPHGLRVPGIYSFNVGIDVCHRFCWREDYRHAPLLNNTVPELNENNNIFTGQITVVDNRRG